MKSTVVDESLSSYKPMYCSREYQTSTRLNQQYEKPTLNYTSRIWGKEATLPRELYSFPQKLTAHPLNSQTRVTIKHLVRPPHLPTPAIALLPPGEGSNSPPGAVQLPSEANSSPPQLLNQANNQTIIQGPPHLPTPGIAHLPPGEGSNSLPGAAQLPSEANSSPPHPLNNQTIRQVQTPAIAHLPPGEGSNSPPGAVQLHSEANSSPPHPPQPRSSTAREENNSSQASNNPHRASQAGHNSNPPRANRQGTRFPPRLQTTQPSPEACATSREGPPLLHTPPQVQPRFFQ